MENGEVVVEGWRFERLRMRAGEWRGLGGGLENTEVEEESWRMERMRRRAGEWRG